MPDTKPTPPAKTIWAYAYQILPPQGAERLSAITPLLDHAHREAHRDARTWTGRVIVEEQVTHILIVSDSPEQNHEVNQRLEAKLHELNTGFSITVPVAVVDDSPLPSSSSPSDSGLD